MKINELTPKTGDIELKVTVSEIGEIREFEKGGAPGRVAKATIKDDTGECKLTLWNEQIDQVKIGAKIKITKGWADEWKGEMQISTGKFGTIEILEHDEILKDVLEPKKTDNKKNPSTIGHDVQEESIYSDDDEIELDSNYDDII